MKTSVVNWILSLLLLVVGILSLVIVYQQCYQPMAEENEKLRSDIEMLEISYATQLGYKEKENYHIAEADRLGKEANETLSRYPKDLWEEDHIAFVDYIHEKTGMNVTSLNWGGVAEVKKLSNGMALTAESITFNYNRSYASLKDLITFLVNDPENQTSLTTLSIAYNAGQDAMSGTMYVNRFYLTGQSGAHTPAKPDDDIQTGQNNILD